MVPKAKKPKSRGETRKSPRIKLLNSLPTMFNCLECVAPNDSMQDNGLRLALP